MFFPSTYQQEIVEICASLRSGSAAGFDNIHIDVVKQNIDIISKPLTRIINLSLSSGIVPKQLKLARIIPLFKSGDQDLYANYRPVSVLPIFSKFLEKVVYKRLYNFLIKCNILFDNQDGFRKNHSTALALHDANADNLIKKLGWIKLDSQRTIHKAVMVYKSLNGLTPDYLSSKFVDRSSVSNYSLRDTEGKLAIPQPHTNYMKNSFSYSGAVLWNSLPNELRQADSLSAFRAGCERLFS